MIFEVIPGVTLREFFTVGVFLGLRTLGDGVCNDLSGNGLTEPIDLTLGVLEDRRILLGVLVGRAGNGGGC